MDPANNTPASKMLESFFSTPAYEPPPRRSVIYKDGRVIMDNMASDHARRLATGMGEGYTTKVAE